MRRLPSYCLFSIALFASAGELMAQGADAEPDETAGEKLTPPVDKEFLPLDVLPPGTVLDKVRLPRYRDGVMLGEVIAERLEIVSGSLVEGRTVDVFWRTGDAAEALTKAVLPEASYDFRVGLMRARGGVVITDSRFVAEGAELDLNLSLRRGWLSSPVTTRFFRQSEAEEVQDQNNKEEMKTSMLMKPGLLGITAACCMGAPPAEPTAAEWAEFESVISARPAESFSLDEGEIRLFEESVSRDGRVDKASDAAEEEIERDTKAAAKAQRRMNEFLGQVGRELVQADPAEGDADEPAKGGDVLGPPLEIPEPDGAAQVLEVRCTGGMFFDAEEGVFVYNEKTQVRDPQFSLDCTKQLKVFLAPKVVAEGEEAKPGEFGELSKIAATGDIVVVTSNEKGEKMVATAEKMTFDAQTGVIMLRGGRLTVQQGNNFTEVSGPGSYIKFSETEGAVAKGKINQRLVKPPQKNQGQGAQ